MRDGEKALATAQRSAIAAEAAVKTMQKNDERQSADIKASIAEAARAAVAMEGLVETNKVQSETLHKTLAAAEQNAKSSSDLVAVTQQSTIILNRAYVYFLLEEENSDLFLSGHADKIIFRWVVQKFGKTPGTIVKCGSVVTVMDPLTAIPTFSEDIPRFGKVVLVELEKSLEYTTIFSPDEAEIFRQSLLQGQSHLFLFGGTEYRDIFGILRKTQWLFRLSGVPRPHLIEHGGQLWNLKT